MHPPPCPPSHDALTGLLPRTAVRDRLSQALSAAGPDPTRAPGLILVDIRHFRACNDRYGPEQGDTLLQHVARRLTVAVRHGDTVARLDGDEFALILPGLYGHADLARVCQRLLDLLAAPYHLDAATPALTFALGAARAPDDGATPADLLRAATRALTHAKAQPGNTWRHYDAHQGAQYAAYLALRDDLALSLRRQEFALHYQPQIELASGRVVGLEALLRWQRPGGGLLRPAAFLTLAEECGLSQDLGLWTLHAACRQLAAWHHAGLPPVTVALNLSAAQVHAPAVREAVPAALARYGLPPARLEIELTESLLLDHTEQVQATLEAWQAQGIRLVLDDFGAGYASLDYLRRYPVDKLKLDRHFIAGLTAPRARAILAGILHIAQALEIPTVAEGVETPAQAAVVTAAGCTLGQGFLYSRPLPAAAVAAWLQAYPPVPPAVVPPRAVGTDDPH